MIIRWWRTFGATL